MVYNRDLVPPAQVPRLLSVPEAAAALGKPVHRLRVRVVLPDRREGGPERVVRRAELDQAVRGCLRV